MKIKNLRIRDKISEIGFYTFTGLIIAGSIAYQFVDAKEQAVEVPDVIEDFNNNRGEITKEFLPGEHRIKRTRVDAFYYETEPIEGYTIESVAIKGYTNIITYANTLPVVAEGKENMDGTVTFDEFGQVITKDSVKTMGR